MQQALRSSPSDILTALGQGVLFGHRSSSQRQTLVTSPMNAGCRRCGVMRRHSCIYSLHLVEIESIFDRRALSVLASGSLPRPNIRDICVSL
jgi:hypothetical protein